MTRVRVSEKKSRKDRERERRSNTRKEKGEKRERCKEINQGGSLFVPESKHCVGESVGSDWAGSTL